jgi:glycosyltransferase involved in cell wall biosynthesis
LVKTSGLDDRVHVVERFITDEERDFLFRHCELVVLPYKRVYQSGVLLMAMSYSKVSIASDLEPNHELIKNGLNGFLFETGNPEPLSRLLEQAYRGRINLEAIGIRAFETVQATHSWERIAASYDAVLQG